MKPHSKNRRILWVVLLIAVLASSSISSALAAESEGSSTVDRELKKAPRSGVSEFNKAGLQPSAATDTSCPQGSPAGGARDDRRVNQDLSCFPQNETSLAVNPRDSSNIVAGANDYRGAVGQSGFYSSFDGGRTWYSDILPAASNPQGSILHSSGDPAIVFDRAGVAYFAELQLADGDDTNGVFVHRSTNGGRTWTRPCVPVDTTPTNPGDDAARCSATRNVDPRSPGDGVVTVQQDNNQRLDSSVPFNDKEYMAIGRRPEGVTPVCFTPITKRAKSCDPARVGVDRIYVSWTRFQATAPFASPIMFSYSDDQGRSWSPPKSINGTAPFCVNFNTVGAVVGHRCFNNQGSVPTVNPRTGWLYVAWQNFDTPHENQYLVVSSRNGGQTFTAPFRAGTVYDVNYPLVTATQLGINDPQLNRQDCERRGAQPFRDVLTNSCFRVNSFGNIVVDKRGGAFADDLYVVISDNRNGTRQSSNVDIFLYKSNNGGRTWIGPTRVNNDRSYLPATVDRDCAVPGEPACPPGHPNYGNDQWFPWVDIGTNGELNVVFHDRRLDTDSTRHEWPRLSRQRPGNYFAWFFGAQCRVTAANSRQCLAPEAREYTGRPTGVVNPGNGVQPGQRQRTFPFRNHSISDVPSNLDYSFRAGIFIGDYNAVFVRSVQSTSQQQAPVGRAYAFWTESRTGRSSRAQDGRNPPCEQSDVYIDIYPASGASSDSTAALRTARYLVAQCP